MLIGEGVRLAKTSVEPMDNNAYLLTHDNDALLLDAAAEPEVLLRQLDCLDLVGVVTTHHHHDHIGALAEVVEGTGAPAFAGAPDAAAITEATGVTCREVWTGDAIELGPVLLEVIGLVGHTPGSIALALTPSDGPVRLFTGDSLFPGGVGKTWKPGDFDTLLADVTAKLFDRFGDDTIVHPGHGDDTTLGAERPHLGEWRARGW